MVATYSVEWARGKFTWMSEWAYLIFLIGRRKNSIINKHDMHLLRMYLKWSECCKILRNRSTSYPEILIHRRYACIFRWLAATLAVMLLCDFRSLSVNDFGYNVLCWLNVIAIHFYKNAKVFDFKYSICMFSMFGNKGGWSGRLHMCEKMLHILYVYTNILYRCIVYTHEYIDFAVPNVFIDWMEIQKEI